MPLQGEDPDIKFQISSNWMVWEFLLTSSGSVVTFAVSSVKIWRKNANKFNKSVR